MNRLKILTWNIALAEPSNAAPDNWDLNTNLFEILKIIEKQDPDILTLQEMPSIKFIKRFVDFIQIEPVPSHSGYVGIFVKKHFEVLQTIQSPHWILVEIKDTHNEMQFYFAAAHLIPYNENRKQRMKQLKDIFASLSNRDLPLLLAGDMNMREDETKSVLEKYVLKDAFLSTSQELNKKFTWNSRINKYHQNGKEFVCRFDRVFLRKLRLKTFDLVGNENMSENIGHYLSDHFGIVISVDFV
ncbi:MAG: endonuclease/exonuclease/phosphatase family protein [Candidatus Kariarchaeaceae archaeon]